MVASGKDVNHSMAVFDVSGSGSVLWTDKGTPDVIVDLRWTSENSWTTIGVKHYYVWKLENGKVSKSGSKAGNKILSGIDINGNDTVCGAMDGSI